MTPGALTIRKAVWLTPPPGHYALPDPWCDIVIDGDRIDILGPMTRARDSSAAGKRLLLLEVDPFVARAWLGVRMEELTDQKASLDAISHAAAGELTRHLERGTLQNLVVGARPGPDRRLATAARALRFGMPVAAAAAAVNFSVRQLERRFLDAVGLNTKAFAQVARLRAAVIAVADGQPQAEAAVRYGFADQSHLARTAKARTGRTVAEIARRVGFVQDRPMARA